jgi:hypothetical protein
MATAAYFLTPDLLKDAAAMRYLNSLMGYPLPRIQQEKVSVI